MHRRQSTRLFAIVALLGSVSAPTADQNARRFLTVEDILNMEDVGRVVVAPDERSVVYERIAPYQDAPNVDTLYFYADRSALAKIERVDLEHPRSTRPLFEQESGGGYWLGGASPDGRKLAVYSLIARDLRAGVFDFETARVTWFDFVPSYYWINQTPVWTSADELIYATLPAGELPLIVLRAGLADRMNRLWKESFRGKIPSASVLVSTPGGASEANTFRRGALVRVDAKSGRTTNLGTGFFYNLRLSPDGRYLAALREAGAIQPDPDVPAGGSIDGGTRKQLVTFDLERGEEMVPCDDCDVPLATMEWSGDSATLMFFAQPVGKRMDHGQFFTYTPADSMLKPVPTGGVQLACDRIWSRPSRGISLGDWSAVFARARDPAADGRSFSPAHCARGQRHDWFLLRAGTEPVNLTRSFRSVSSELLGASREAIIVVADGDVWKLGPPGLAKNLTRSVSERLAPWDHVFKTAAYSEEIRYLGEPLSWRPAVLQSPREVGHLDLERGRYRAINRPEPGDQLVALSASTHTAVFRRDTQRGATLLAVKKGDAAHPVISINQHLAHVETGREAQIRYSLAGEEVSSCALLPPNWMPSRRYPLVVHVYPNTSGTCSFSEIQKFNPWNLQLLAAQGYVVLFPNTAKKYIATADGPTYALTQTVLVAVDAAVSAGYADSNRVGLFGFSQGHHSVLQVVSQTNRFGAAVVAFGCADFASQYGAMPLFARLLPFGSVGIGDAERFESMNSDNYLGVRPWEDPNAYVRNSPVFHADRIHTPLLIMHSDFDLFPLGQSGEIFSALYRLRREATYVTYWGEGHGVLSPANIRDTWHRVLTWYARHLRDGDANE